jgi:dTDP-4-amino-4,6-dideoxygalactose transaminase
MNQITVTSPLLPNLDELNKLMQDIWSRKWITNMGHYHELLEAELAKYLGVEYISLFTNGTLPLITALQALGLTKGEVITTPYSFVATTHSIWWNQLTPVFVDIEEETCGMDPAKIEAAITENTVAIMPVHCYGKPCKAKEIDAIAKKHGLKVIYDAAHAFGVRVPAPSNSPEGGESGHSNPHWQTADPALYNILKANATHNRHNSTQAEEVLWQLLKSHNLDEHFRRQHIIMDYIADFVCLRRMLIIEADGEYHFTPEQQLEDTIRENRLREQGFEILRFKNNEILCNPDGVVSKIKETLNSRPLRGSQEEASVSILEFGDISTLSFHATKVYNTIEGGALVCHSKEMKEKIDHLKNFGFEDEVTVVAPGINSKMDEVRAAYGLLNLKQVDAAIEARQKVANAYREALRNVKGIRFFDDMPGVKHNYSYFPIFINEAEYGMSRDALYEKMKSQGILGRRYFYPLISTFDPYREYQTAAEANLPVATKVANEVLCLPMHHALSDDDIKRILECIIK